MLQQIFKFSLLLLLCAGISYGIHFYVYKTFFPDASLQLINFSYKFNFGITFLFTSTILLASRFLKDQLGFIFLGGSFVKLGIFLFIIKTSQLSIDKSVILDFFIPYTICVILEIVYVMKILNQSNFNIDK